MESSVNGDQNFYSRRPLPKSPEQQHQQRSYEPPPLPAFDDLRSPQSPPSTTFLPTSSLQAGPSNDYGNGYAVNDSSDPDEFYREPRKQLSNEYSEFTHSGMATAASEARRVPSSLRSNGNGSTPKHPSVPIARTGLKPSNRSASAPVNERSLGSAKSTPALHNGYGQTQKPSVKELSKRFDKNNEPSNSVTRKPAPRVTTSSGGNGTVGYMRDRNVYTSRNTVDPDGAGAQRAGAMTRDVPGQMKSPTTKPTQRARFASEDQQSNNALSSAVRSARPRNPATGSISQASKSMVDLSPTSPKYPAQVPARKPLFGEVLPFGQLLPDVGYGIPHTATRRTSDSSLHPSSSHNRSRSDVEVSPSSPTAWYLGVTPALDDVDTHSPRPSHNRNHSDFADSKVNTMTGVDSSAFQPSPAFSTPDLPEVSTSSSRIPVASKSRSSLSDSSSPPSSRANSPFNSRALSNGKLRKAEQRPWSPAGRATTPTNSHSTTRRSPRSKAQNSNKPTMNTSSLTAYVSVPPPKTSPPLRSSMGRPPVSSASTASSRQRAVARSGSPQQVRSRMNVKRSEGPKEREVVDVGPVDFAERRATIQRAYTKSIHENEQREIRAANLQRLKERHAHDETIVAGQKEEVESPEAKPQPERISSPGKSSQPLHISTSFPNQHPVGSPAPNNLDSPTLGMPGTFVDDDEAPQSALSTATGTTEFDNEPQTEAAQVSGMPFAPRTVTRMISSHALPSYGMSPYEASFGMGQEISPNDAGSIPIMLGATPVELESNQPVSTPKQENIARESTPPGAFKQDAEFPELEQPVFTSTLTTASPQKTTPEEFRATGSLKSGDDMAAQGADTNVEDQGTMAPEEVLEKPSTMAVNDAAHDFLNTPVTEIDYESSDGFGTGAARSEQGYEESGGEGETSRIFRKSTQSTWTDYTVETTDACSASPDSAVNPEAFSSEERTESFLQDDSPSLKPELSSKPEDYNLVPSPRLAQQTPPQTSLAKHQSPSLTTDDLSHTFSEVPSRSTSTSVPLWPDYAPPPPPANGGSAHGDALPAHSARSPPPLSFYNKRPPSSVYQGSVYQGSQNGTSRNTESQRTSEDVYSSRPSSSTPRSSTQVSLEDVSRSQTIGNDPIIAAEESTQDAEAAEALRKRLYQRKMLILELISTEAVYLKDMNVVEEIYKGTAEACPKLDANDIKAIFRNTDEIVAFSTAFLDELKSATSVYSPRSKSKAASLTAAASPATDGRVSIAQSLNEETDDQKDRKTFVGANIGKQIPQMQTIYSEFLKNSEAASTRLSILQGDGAVTVWLDECNNVAKDLTAAWDLDALLVKPVQRITRYELFVKELIKCTPTDHPDYAALKRTGAEMTTLVNNINELKKRIHMVGQIVGRKRKESDVRSGLAKAFGRRAEKLQASSANRPRDDDVYLKLNEKYHHNFLRLQIMLRDFEFYTRQVTTYVNDFLRYLSSIEVLVRHSASPYPELESKWARFNMSMRVIGTVALEDHITDIRKCIVEPIDKIIMAYNAPELAMRKRAKRRLDYEKFLAATAQGKKIEDKKLIGQVDEYEALNETLKMELPKLFAGSQKIAKICLAQFVRIQSGWYSIWQDKVRVVIEDNQLPKDLLDIVDMFNRDFRYVEARAQELGIVNGTIADDGIRPRISSQSTLKDDGSSSNSRPRPSNLSSRDRGFSVNSDKSPSLPTPDFAKRHSGQFTFSPIIASTPGMSVGLPQFAHQTQFPASGGHSRVGSGSPATPDVTGSRAHSSSFTRPSTSRSHTSESGVRMGTDYNNQHRRESGSTLNSASYHVDGPLSAGRPYSGVFHSALPLPDGPEDSQRSSRASSRDRNTSGGYNVLYLAASLFEFNISQTKSEAGYPYLTYQAGEIFDVIGEKGELWLAKNQDDPSDTVGWIWSKHFARLAND